MHDDQLTVPVETVTALVDAQFPRWRGLPVKPVRSQGTVNAIFRIGDRLTARFPLSPATPGRAAVARGGGGRGPRAPRPHAVPDPRAGRASGSPGPATRCLVGADLATRRRRHRRGPRRVGGVRARPGRAHRASVRAIDTRGRTFRGRAAEAICGRTTNGWRPASRRSEGLLDVARLRRTVGGHARTAARRAADVMTHGDLIPGNVLVAGGRLAGVLDVGGLGAGRPGAGPRGAWHLLDARAATGAPRGSRLRRARMGARQGVGVRAGDGRRLVLRTDTTRR